MLSICSKQFFVTAKPYFGNRKITCLDLCNYSTQSPALTWYFLHYARAHCTQEMHCTTCGLTQFSLCNASIEKALPLQFLTSFNSGAAVSKNALALACESGCMHTFEILHKRMIIEWFLEDADRAMEIMLAAARGGNPMILERLLQHKVLHELLVRTPNIFFAACYKGSIEVVKYFYEKVLSFQYVVSGEDEFDGIIFALRGDMSNTALYILLKRESYRMDAIKNGTIGAEMDDRWEIRSYCMLHTVNNNQPEIFTKLAKTTPVTPAFSSLMATLWRCLVVCVLGGGTLELLDAIIRCPHKHNIKSQHRLCSILVTYILHRAPLHMQKIYADYICKCHEYEFDAALRDRVENIANRILDELLSGFWPLEQQGLMDISGERALDYCKDEDKISALTIGFMASPDI
jgi:hypothetical protein